MRLNECEQVKETLEKHLGINLTVVDGAELFLSRLMGVTEPEKKRKIIGGTCMLPRLSVEHSSLVLEKL
jgi:GMP synthase (glutamine-hydrolysing)